MYASLAWRWKGLGLPGAPPNLWEAEPLGARRLSVLVLGMLFALAACGAPVREPVSRRDTGKCVVTGCGGEICADAPTVSACLFRLEDACSRTARCGRQPDGKCGWTQTEDLKQCLRNPPNG